MKYLTGSQFESDGRVFEVQQADQQPPISGFAVLDVATRRRVAELLVVSGDVYRGAPLEGGLTQDQAGALSAAWTAQGRPTA